MADIQTNGGTASQYGQSTRSDVDSVEPGMFRSKAGVSKKQTAPGVKIDNAQRARNAAIQRHTKTKSESDIREDSKRVETPEFSGGEAGVENKRERYREKNRLAAAKCRMKKKDNVQGLEEKNREMSAENNFAKVEMRQLRDELTCLRTMALHHAAHIEGCDCVALHAYNAMKAGELASEWSIPAASSTSSGSDSIVASPVDCDAEAEHLTHLSGSTNLQRKRPQSMTASATYGSTQGPVSKAMQTTANMGDNSRHSFSEYLHNSARGNGSCR